MTDKIFPAGNDPRFSESREPHGLSLVKLRILKCSQMEKPADHGLGKTFLFNKNQIREYNLCPFG